MRKRTKYKINSGNSFKFGWYNPRSCKHGLLVKRMFNGHTLSNGGDYKTLNKNIHFSVSKRIDDGGLLEGLYEHIKTPQRVNRYYRLYNELRDEHIIYSLDKRKRWNIPSKVANEIATLHANQIEPGLDVHLPKHLISLLETETYFQHDDKWRRNAYGRNTITDYHDNRIGHIKSKKYAADWKCLREHGEDQLMQQRFNNLETLDTKVGVAKPAGHNQHYRGIQRKGNLKRTSSQDQTCKSEKPCLESLPEVRYEVLKERRRDGFKAHNVGKYARSVARQITWSLKPNSPKALKKIKGMRKGRHLRETMFNEKLNQVQFECSAEDMDQEDSVLDAEAFDPKNETTSHYVVSNKNHVQFGDWLANIDSQAKPQKKGKLPPTNHVSNGPCNKTKNKNQTFVNTLSGSPVKKNGVVYETNEDESCVFLSMSKSKEMKNTNGTNTGNEEESRMIREYSTQITNSSSPCIVHITADSVDPSYLKRRFGDAYRESRCFPRKFCICLNKGRFTEEEQCRILFEVIGVESNYTCMDNSDLEIIQTFRVRAERPDTHSMNQLMDSISNRVTCTDDIVNAMEKHIQDTNDQQHITKTKRKYLRSDKPRCDLKTQNRFSHLENMCGWNIKICGRRKARKWIREDIDDNEKQLSETLGVAVPQQPMFSDTCGICLEKFHSSMSSITNGLAMIHCNHWFCVDCWRYYLLQRILTGQLNLQCPGHQCNTSVDHVTLLTLLSHVTYVKYVTMVVDATIGRGNQWQWCPNRRCGKVVRVTVNGKDPVGHQVCVSCSCKTQWCFDCREEPHWPAHCNAYLAYKEYIRKKRSSASEKAVTVIKVKKCPSCKEHITKDGGCSQMMCRCGCQFCWECLKLGSNHEADGSCIRRAREKAITFRYSDDECLDINEQIYLMALEYRDLRTACTSSTYVTNLVKGHMRQTSANMSCSVEDYQTNELEMVKELQEFMHQAFHILEYSLVSIATFRKHEAKRQLPNILDASFIINVMHHALLASSKKKHLTKDIQRAYLMMQRASDSLERNSKKIYKMQSSCGISSDYEMVKSKQSK